MTKLMRARAKFRPFSRATNAYDLLNDVCDAVLTEPRRIDMGTWLTSALGRVRKPNSGLRTSGLRVPSPRCGTVACIAGWCATIKMPRNRGLIDDKLVEGVARDMLLGDAIGMRDDIYNLFHGREEGAYPFPRHRVGTQVYARAVVANIRKFQTKWADALRAKAV